MKLKFCAAVLALAMAAEAGAATPPNAGGLIYVSNQKAGVSVVDAATLSILRSADLGATGPRGLALTPDGRTLLTANRRTGDLAVVDTETMTVRRRIAIGKNPEFLRIMPDGSKAFVTYEPSATGGPPRKAERKDDDGPRMPGQVAIVDLKTWQVVGSIVGAPETEGIEFTPDGKRVVVTNEGDDTMTVYAIADGRLLQTVDLSHYGHRPRGIKVAPDGRSYIVTMENSNNFVVLDATFKIVKSVATGLGPYGVAFDRAGRRIVVAAARAGKVEVFDADSYARVAEAAVGKRCWHFSFTPDESRLLAACGRSNDLVVIDATTYRAVKTLPGFATPWGVVAYPKASGSLDVPAR
jgi:YVTN family beta-propeller protein